jgi:hypothetical protein
MAYEITNKALAVIIGIAIVLNVGFLVFGGKTLTGYSTLNQEGTAAVNITAELAINVSQPAIDFGTGRLAYGLSECRLESTDLYDGTGVPTCWVNVTEYLVTGSHGFKIDNVGNQPARLDVNASKDASAFIGGTNPGYQYQYRPSGAGSYTSANACTTAAATSWSALGPGAVSLLCDSFAPTESVEMDVAVRVPADAAGFKQSVVYFFAQTA